MGFNLQKHVGLELEGGYATNSLDSVGGANVNWTGADVSAWSGFGNLVLRSDLSETVSLFAAGGPGFVHYNFDILGASTSETVFAGQAKAGISLKVADNASVDLTYRSRFVGSSGGVSSCVNHQITAGFSIGF